MRTILSLSNSANWAYFWGGTFTAPEVPGNLEQLYSYYPNDLISCPYTAESPIIACLIESSTAKPTWKRAGHINQKIPLGITVGGEYNTYLSSFSIFLNRFTLCRWPNISIGDYSLSFHIHYWIRDVTISIWEYTGIYTDSHEVALQEIKQAVIP